MDLPKPETRPSPSDVREGRLLRKIEKLKKQRDHYKELHDYYAKVISMQPYIERRYKTYTDMKEDLAKRRAMEARVKEQEQLIVLLMKQVKQYEYQNQSQPE